MQAAVISYPCSGRTWVFNIARNLGLNIKFTHDIFENEQDTLHWRKVAERYNAPENAECRKKFYENVKKALLIRDPRDILISYYYQKKYREPDMYKNGFIKYSPNISCDLDSFCLDNRYGIKTITEFYRAVLDNCSIDSIIAYEELHKNTFKYMNLLLKQLCIKTRRSRLKSAVKESTFKSLQFNEGVNRVFSGRSNDVRVFKLRNGKVGSYKGVLKKSTILKLNNHLQKCTHPMFDKYRQN